MYVHLASGAIGECDYEKYANGCYSQANFICDKETNLCKCHPESPVLIEQRICVKRKTANEICQYNEQCDNGNGFYCTYSDFRNITTNNLPASFESSRDLKDPFPRCRNPKFRHKPKQQQQQQQQQTSSSISLQQQQTKRNQNSTSSTLPRLVWLVLIACLFGLIGLLLLIKFQYYRVGQPFQHQEDHLSINSEIDVPPPYEVAIRMKL